LTKVQFNKGLFRKRKIVVTQSNNVLALGVVVLIWWSQTNYN